MATAYTNLLGFALPVTGELSGTWGDTVNNSITQLVEDSVAGYATASVTSGDWTLTTTGSGAANQARSAILIPTGTPGVTRNIIAPSSSKAYIVHNESNAAVVIKGAATTGATIEAGRTVLVAWDTIDFRIIVPQISLAADVTGVLPSANGGTNSEYFSVSGPSSTVKTYTFPNENMNVGYKSIPQSGSQVTTSYTLQTSDVGKFIQIGSGGSITLPDSVFATGDVVVLFNNTSGSVTLTCNTTTTYMAGTDTDKATISLATRGVANVLFISGTIAVVSGNVT
jgi:hypothetical protein